MLKVPEGVNLGGWGFARKKEGGAQQRAPLDEAATQGQEAVGSEAWGASGAGGFGEEVLRPRNGCRPNSISFSLSFP